jgi:TolA-binding protein
MRQHLFAIAAFATLLPFGAAAQPLIQSQEGIALENQILQLQSQLQQLQSNNGGSALGEAQPAPAPSDGSGGPPNSIVASLLTEVQQLQVQVQQLNGEVDTLQNQVNTQHDATEKEIGDLNFKLAGGAAPGAPGAASLSVPPPPPAVASVSPKAALHAAQEAIIHGDYPAAETNARAVLATAKSSPEGYQAQYILAQSLYGQGKAQDAAIAFDDAYNRNRDGDYAPGSLLGLADSLAAIHQDAAACDTLASLNSQFPTPPKDLQSGIGAASKRAHCS